MKAEIPGGSPGGIDGGIFFLTGSRRENTRAGKIPAGSRRESGFSAGSRQDPGAFFTRVYIYLTIIRRRRRVNIGGYLPSRRRGKYSPIFTEPKAINCFSINSIREHQKVQNNELKLINKTQKI